MTCGLLSHVVRILAGVELKPGFAIGSWFAFEKMSDEGMAMGDLVPTIEEVSPIMKKLAEGGIEVTALHNYLLRSQPCTCMCSGMATQ